MRLNSVPITSRIQMFSSLRHRDFRLYWFGHLFAVSGYQIIILVQGWLIWTLTGSEYLLGALGLSNAIPAVLLSLFGGVVADKVDLRRLLIMLQWITTFALITLATFTLTGYLQIWHIFSVVILFGIVQAFDNPSRQALFPHLIDRRDLMNAVSLNSTIWPGTRIFGPALAGFVIDKVGAATNNPLVGAATAIYLASLGFALFGLCMFLVQVPPFERSHGRNILQDLGDGLKFVLKNRLFTFLAGMNFMNIFLVSTYITLLPVFASSIFEGDASTLGFLYAAAGIGSLFGALSSAASLGYFRRIGWLIIGGATAQALFVMLFAVSRLYFFSLFLLLLAGIGFSLFMVSAHSTVQLLVPDEFRGRVMAIWGMNYGAVYPLGQMQMGMVAGLSRTYLSDLLGRFAGAPSAVFLGSSVMLLFSIFGAGTNHRIRTLSSDRLEKQP